MWADHNLHLDEAEDMVNRALQFDPNNGAYLDTLGWIHYRKAKFEDALNDLLRAAQNITRPDPIGANPGSYGWSGGFGTNFIVDPAADMVAILLVQRLMRGPDDGALNEEFLTLAYQAIDG